MKECTNGACTPNQSIKGTVSHCALHCQIQEYCGLTQRQLYATCVGVIFPVCLVSAAVYLLRGQLDLEAALPYLLGGLIGGWIGGRLYGKVPTAVLKWLFAAFLFYGGVRYLL